MVAIRGVAHFSIAVSDTAKSTKLYTEVVGCRHLSTTPNGQMVFLDAAGTCLILVKNDAPINLMPDNHGGGVIMPLRLHTTTMAQRSIIARARCEMTFEEDRQGGVLNGPRAYFHDPDATVLEFIDLTSYAGWSS